MVGIKGFTKQNKKQEPSSGNSISCFHRNSIGHLTLTVPYIEIKSLLLCFFKIFSHDSDDHFSEHPKPVLLSTNLRNIQCPALTERNLNSLIFTLDLRPADVLPSNYRKHINRDPGRFQNRMNLITSVEF